MFSFDENQTRKKTKRKTTATAKKKMTKTETMMTAATPSEHVLALFPASVLQLASPEAIRRVHRVQTVTIAWMSVEAAVSLFAAWRARSPALLAFGHFVGVRRC